jgi:quinoprotein glucose dehydrogenase
MMDAAGLKKEMATRTKGNGLYLRHCSNCHGADRKGNASEIPNLLNVGSRRTPDQINTILKTGIGRMPSFQHLPEHDRGQIVNYLLNRKEKAPPATDEHSVALADSQQTKKDFPYEPLYVNKTWKKFNDQDGYNAIKPPWGTLNAIDLNTGDFLWRVPLGEYPELTKKGIPITGTESYGGPVVTGGGLVFIGGTRDERIRAFDRKTGKVLWEYQLPAGGYATPITYEANGKQYVVIAAGGARGSKPGGWYVAFAL